MPGMRQRLQNTPVFALDAVVLDTETTGLDARTARIVEIGAVTIGGGRIVEERTFHSFVAVSEPIPPTQRPSTA